MVDSVVSLVLEAFVVVSVAVSVVEVDWVVPEYQWLASDERHYGLTVVRQREALVSTKYEKVLTEGSRRCSRRDRGS